MSDVIVTDTNGIIGMGEGYEFTIPPGKYTREQLQEIILAEQRRVIDSRRVTFTVVKPYICTCGQPRADGFGCQTIGCVHYGR